MIGLIGNTVFFAMFGLANTLFMALLPDLWQEFSMEI